MARYCLSVCALFVVAALARGDDDEVLRLHPAPLPSPALKHRLLPDLRTQTAGDAVPVYLDALEKFQPLLNAAWRQPGGYPFAGWAEKSLADLPRDEVREAFEPYKDILELVDKAARRERCIGDGPVGQAKSPKNVRLPESYYLGELSSLLATRARLQMADGDLTGALHTIQTGFAAARQLGELPRIDYAYAGLNLAQLMLRQLDDFVQQPKAPNLYWALTDLPQPLFDARKGVEGQRWALVNQFPAIAAAVADPDAGPLTEEQVQEYVRVLLRYFRQFDTLELQQRVQLGRRITDNYEADKKALLDAGRSKEKVEAMPHVQVVLLAQFEHYDRKMDEQLKWYNEPFTKSFAQADTLTLMTRQGRPRSGPLQPILPFPLVELYSARAKVERKIAYLRCVEAVRAYAAAHDGKLPAALDAIKEVPLPLDPASGKAFEYTLDGAKATLETPTPAKEIKRYFDELTWEFTIKRP